MWHPPIDQVLPSFCPFPALAPDTVYRSLAIMEKKHSRGLLHHPTDQGQDASQQVTNSVDSVQCHPLRCDCPGRGEQHDDNQERNGRRCGLDRIIPANAINGTIFTLGCSVGVTATGATGYDHACAEHDVGFTEGFKRSSASPPQPERLVLHRLLCAQQRPLTCRVRVRVHSKKPRRGRTRPGLARPLGP